MVYFMYMDIQKYQSSDMNEYMYSFEICRTSLSEKETTIM